MLVRTQTGPGKQVDPDLHEAEKTKMDTVQYKCVDRDKSKSQQQQSN